MADVYDATRGLAPDVEARIGDRLAAILRERSPMPSVFEVGVGSGRIAVPLAARGIRVTGADISRRMMARLRSKRHDIGVVFAEASRPPFRPASFDAAIFAHVLHLVPDPQATLRATIACVRGGGLVFNCDQTYSEGAAHRAGERLKRIVADVAGTTGRAGDRDYRTDDVFRDVLARAGASFEAISAAEWVETTTARGLVNELESRSRSNTWTIPDTAMPEVVRRFSSDAEAIYGGLDTPAAATASFTVTIARLPR